MVLLVVVEDFMRTPLGAATEEGRGVSAAPQLSGGIPSRYVTPSPKLPWLGI